jgi:hypothetical protein
VKPQAEIVGATANAFVVRLQWRPKDSPEDRELFQVLKMRGEKIREMADYHTDQAAAKAAS